MRKGIALFGMLTFISCGESKEAIEKVCGECPDVAKGDLMVSGSAQIDGFFKALNIFQSANARISGEFQAHLNALAEAYGFDCTGMSLGDCVGGVKGAITTDLDASVTGGLKVHYVPPKCSASAKVAVEAQAECTVDADVNCTPPTIDPGHIEVECKGECSGGCTGMCSGSCALEVAGGSCSGTCEGACEGDLKGTCSGTCRGQCNGTCSAGVDDGMGGVDCRGTCTGGSCEGTCELAVAASCTGMCTGKCVAPMADAECMGECRGSCDAKCSGSCKGSAEPPSIEGGECDAEVQANCKASASAQASASVECTPPQLDVDFEFNANLDAAGRAAFVARLTVLKAEMIGIIQGLVNARVLVEGDATAMIPSIEETLSAQIDAAGDLGFDALEGVTPYGALCAATALIDAAAEVGDSAAELGGTLSASVELSGSIGTF